jgi:hypothetical protein
MAISSLNLETMAVNDLTTQKAGDISLWIRKQKEYLDVPDYVSDELCRRMSCLSSVSALLPPPSLPVLQVLEVTTPQTMEPSQDTKPEGLFSFNEATHMSAECLTLSAPTKRFLSKLRGLAGQAMLNSKVSIQH